MTLDPTEGADTGEGEEEEDEGLIDPSTGQPFPDTPEGRTAKKAFLTERRNAKHPHGGPKGQQGKQNQKAKNEDV
jgi:hypothetical protein